MGQTTRYKLPYVEPGDALVNFPVPSKDLAQKLEGAIVQANLPGDLWTAQAGWACAQQYSIKIGQLLFYYLSGTRTGANLTVSAATGAVAGGVDQNVVKLDTARYPVVAWGQASSAFRLGNYTLNAAGMLILTYATGTADIATGNAWGVRGLAVLA